MGASIQEFLIALGGNMPSGAGVPALTLRQALVKLGHMQIEVEAVSGFYRTPAFPAGAGPDYVNAAAKVRFDGPPAAFLDRLHEVEAEFGRERVERWGRRTLDLDLLAQGGTVLPDAATQTEWRSLPAEKQIDCTPPGLILPHPRLQDRAFVLVPLADVAPDWVHPVTGLSVTDMLALLPESDRSDVVLIDPESDGGSA